MTSTGTSNSNDFEIINENDLIPLGALSYKVIIDNNVYQLELKEKAVLDKINIKAVNRVIDNVKKQIVLNVEFNKKDCFVFNKILDNSNLSIDIMTNALDKAHEFFEDYEVTRKTQNTIDRYINMLGRNESIWNSLVCKPDYNLSLFKNRTLPFYNIECKDWVKANIDAMKNDYPTEIIRTSINKSADGKLDNEFSEEINMINRNNNFLAWSILPIDKYPDMDKLTRRITVFNKIGLEKQALTMFLKLLISPKDCHIIKEPSMWNLFKPRMASNKYIEEIVRYCCCYSMYILRQEETIMFSQVNMKYRVLFTLEQACNMPVFSKAHMDRDPYILQLTDESTRLSETIPFYVREGRFINDKKERI